MTTFLTMNPSTKTAILVLGLMIASFFLTGCATNSD